MSEADDLVLEDYTRKLFQRGSEIAAARGLILVDTKYEFGKTKDGKIVLIDEIHTPDSSRYFYADGYQDRQDRGESQKQLSKEFVRQWLMAWLLYTSDAADDKHVLDVCGARLTIKKLKRNRAG